MAVSYTHLKNIDIIKSGNITRLKREDDKNRCV